MKIKDRRVMTVIVTGLLFAALLLARQDQTALVNGDRVMRGKEKVCVVIDAGHGGSR